MSDLLQQAQAALAIRDVYLVASRASLAENFDPKYGLSAAERSALLMQWQSTMSKLEVIQLSTAEDDAAPRLLRIYVDLAIRLADPAIQTLVNPKPAQLKKLIKAEISATFVGEYQMTGELPEDAIEVFANRNATFHVWPFWREYLLNTSSRMNLPRIVAPLRPPPTASNLPEVVALPA